jgi:RNA polymerase sigma factor (TIGR02999 family)
MPDDTRPEVTRLLVAWSRGDTDALAALSPLVYEELRRIAENHLRRERGAHTLQRTALVHEAFLRLVDQRDADWRSRAQFYALASRMMRRILVDYARRRSAAKRGAGPPLRLEDVLAHEEPEIPSAADAAVEVEGAVPLLDVEAALEKLEAQDPRRAKLVEMRFFAGLSIEDAAAALGISLATAKRDWAFARAWLTKELGR